MVEPGLLQKYQYASRASKAQKIGRILEDHLAGGRDLASMRCLDLGCSIGVISDHLASTFGHVVGLEPQEESTRIAKDLHPGSRAAFVQGDGLRLPFGDEVFDVIVCAQVYEHSADPQQLVAEIRRTLRPGGCCFFSGPNRLWPVEYHYRWLMLHWLPRAWVDTYCLRRYGRGYDLVLYNYWQLQSLWQGFERIDYTLRLIYESERFLRSGRLQRWARLVPQPLALSLRFLLANYNWILVKVPPDG
jgi:SAM-dependent methyltransferase